MKIKRAVLALIMGASSALAATGASFKIVKEIPVPGHGSWDYLTVDAANRRLYVSHETEINVLDLDSYALVGAIPAQGAHGIAVAAEYGHGFSTNGRSNTVTMFDLKTLQVLSTIKAGEGPDGIIYDAATHRVFAFNGDGNSSTVIDATDGKVVGTVDLGGGPEFAAADGNGSVFNNLEDASLLLKIDSRSLKVDSRWPLAPCQRPSSMAFDVASRRIFIGCRSRVMAVVDAASGKVVTTLPIGDHVDATNFDPDTHTIFNSNGDGTITVVHQDSPDKYSVVQTVKTYPHAKTSALDPKTHQLFLSTNVNGNFAVLVVAQ